MKNKLAISMALCALIFAGCKKENNSSTPSQQSAASQQIEQIVAKYPNLKLATTKLPQNLSAASLKAFDDSLAKFSKFMKSVKVITKAPLANLILNPVTGKTKAVNDYQTASSQYNFTNDQYVGSSYYGYYDIHYSSLIQYETNNSTNIFLNYITGINSISAYSPPAGFGSYGFSLVDTGSSYSIATDQMSVDLSFKCTGTFSYYDSGSGTTTYSSVDFPYSPTVNSSELPYVYTPLD